MKIKFNRAFKLLAFSVLTVVLPISDVHAALPQMIGNLRNQVTAAAPPDQRMHRPFHVELDFNSPSTPGKGAGMGLELGWIGNSVGADLRMRFGEMQFGQFFSQPTQAEFAAGATPGASATTSPQSEINRPRSQSAGWGYFLIEPGISVTGRLFPSYKWSQSGRVGIARSYFSDSSNSLSFAGWIFTSEALMRYHFALQSGTSFHFGFGYNFGWVTRTTSVLVDGRNDATLPIHFVNYVIGVRQAF